MNSDTNTDTGAIATTQAPVAVTETAQAAQVAPQAVARRKPAKAAASAAGAGGLNAAVDGKRGNGGDATQRVGGRLAQGLQQPDAGSAGNVSYIDPTKPPAIVCDDGYDLRFEFGVVKHLVMAEEPDVEDVSYARYLVYLDRVRELEIKASALVARRYANAEVMGVAPQAVNRLPSMGALTSDKDDLSGEGGDVIEIHTQEALRLFIGFDAGTRADGSKQYPIPGAVRVGTALRTITSVAARFGNPYAELSLIQIEALFKNLSLEIAELQGKHEHLIAARGKRGMKLTVRRNQTPVVVPLGFRSPYGYACADLVAQFDYLTRVIATTAKAGLLVGEAIAKSGDEANTVGDAMAAPSNREKRLAKFEGRLDGRDIKTKFRGVYTAIMRMAQVLGQPELAEVNRGDWIMYQLTRGTAKSGGLTKLGVKGKDLRSGGEIAREAREEGKRLAVMRAVHACEMAFGELPRDLLIGELQPAYVTSKLRVSAEERVLMMDIVGRRIQV